MSTTTKTNIQPAGVAGPNDESETILMGDDLAALKSVEDIDDESPATEGLSSNFHFSLEGFDPTDLSKVTACEEGEGENKPVPPCVSRVIDKDGNARITIILGANERKHYIGLISALIDSASENDVVDISVVSGVSGQAGTMSQRSILSAIDRCQGHVITRAGALTTVGDVAIWLSGDELKVSPMGCIFMRQPVAGYFGDVADFESKLKDYKESMKEFSSYIVERGLFQKEEMDSMYDHRSMVSLFGDELRSRLASLKEVKES